MTSRTRDVLLMFIGGIWTMFLLWGFALMKSFFAFLQAAYG